MGGGTDGSRLAPSPRPYVRLIVRNNGLSSGRKYVPYRWPALRDIHRRRVVYAVRGGSLVFLERQCEGLLQFSFVVRIGVALRFY